MNKSVLAGAALAAFLSSGNAHAQAAHLDLSYQTNDRGSFGDINSTALSGGVLLGQHVQLNGRYANVDAGGAHDYWGADAFLFNRSDGGSYGGYVGYDSIGVYDEWSVGGFLQAFTANTNWTAQLNYSDTQDASKILTLDGEGRFFVNNDFSVQANLGYGNIDVDGGDSDTYWSGGLGAEWGVTGTPISIYGGWQHFAFDGGDTNTYGIGVRWNFGGGSVKDNSRSGASFARIGHTAGELELGGGVAPR